MKMMKQMACAALVAAVAVGISGCSPKSASYSQPKVVDGSIAAIASRPAENTSLSALCKQYGLGMADMMKQAPDKDAQEVIKELELDKAKIDWLAVTFGALSAEKVEKGEPDFSVAIASSLDLDKAIAVAEKKNKDKDESIKKETIANVPAYVLLKGEKPEAYMANLDKQLILVANTSAGLEKLIALYRDGKGASADFGSFALGANDLIRVKAVKVGANVKTALPDPEMLKMVNSFVPDGDKIVQGLGAVELSLGAADKDIKLDLSVETAADADADKLVTLAKTGLMALTAQLKEGAEKDANAKMGYDALQGAKLEAKGKLATLTASVAADPALKALSEQVKALK